MRSACVVGQVEDGIPIRSAHAERGKDARDIFRQRWAFAGLDPGQLRMGRTQASRELAHAETGPLAHLAEFCTKGARLRSGTDHAPQHRRGSDTV